MDETSPAAKRKNQENMLLFLSYPPFQEEAEKLRGSTELKDEVRKIVRKYRVPQNYAPYIVQHILNGTKDAPTKNYEVSSSDGEVGVRVFARLNKAEIAELKGELDRASEDLPDFKALVDIEYKLENEAAIQGVRERNNNPDREYHEIYRKALNVSPKRAQHAREHARELADLRKKRFG